MDALRAPIGGPPAEGSVRLRLPSPTAKQSTGLFAFISGVRPKLMLLPLLRFAYAGDFAPCGERLGAPPQDPASLSRKAGPKAFSSLLLKV